MSAFLGPIHYWLFHKIKIQNELAERTIQVDESIASELNKSLELKYGKFPQSELAEIIDESNIHGWLQTYVSQVEYKLADAVTILIDKNPDNFTAIKEVFFNKGKELSDSVSSGSAAEIYKMIGDTLLDGMPCDHANMTLEENNDQVIWQRQICVHNDYWEEVGGKVENYYILREEFIKGILTETDFEFQKIDETTNKITKKA